MSDPSTATAHTDHPQAGGPPPRTVSITVNTKPVTAPDKDVTGLQVKQAAIDAGLPIDLGFQLLLEKPNGHDEPIADDTQVRVHEGSAFSAIAADDNS